MSHADLLRNTPRAGVYRLPEEATWIPRAARTDGFAYWRVDLAKVRGKTGLLTALARALDFPAWFGGNWDALQDCLGDLSWRTAPGYVIALEHCDGLATHTRADFEMLLDVFGAAADFWRGQRIPFWVFVGSVSEGLRDCPQADQGA